MCIPNINYIDVNAETMLPDVTERSISCYLGQFNAQISKTAKLLNDERYIEYLKHGHSESYVFFKAAIFVQMKKAKYLADLKMDTNGIISEAQCECQVGMDPSAHCKHIQAILLYGLSRLKKDKELKIQLTCTEKLQKFHVVKIHTGSPVKAESLKLLVPDNIIYDPSTYKMPKENYN